MKLAGVAMILLGALGAFGRYCVTQRQELELLRDVIAAIGDLESAVRWRKLPLPDGLREQAGRKVSGRFFAEIGRYMTGGMTLQSAWEKTFRQISPEAAEILCALEWQGDSQQLQGSLGQCAELLTQLRQERRSSLRQREKLCAAATLSAAGVLIILLM